MIAHPAVVVHGLGDAVAALAPGYPVTLLSARGAALNAGCLWWTALVARARANRPATECCDILDCADAPGLAMAALRSGQHFIILSAGCPAFAAVAAAAGACGARVLCRRPPSLDLADPAARLRLYAWLAPARARP